MIELTRKSRDLSVGDRIWLWNVDPNVYPKRVMAQIINIVDVSDEEALYVQSYSPLGELLFTSIPYGADTYPATNPESLPFIEALEKEAEELRSKNRDPGGSQ